MNTMAEMEHIYIQPLLSHLDFVLKEAGTRMLTLMKSALSRLDFFGLALVEHPLPPQHYWKIPPP